MPKQHAQRYSSQGPGFPSSVMAEAAAKKARIAAAAKADNPAKAASPVAAPPSAAPGAASEPAPAAAPQAQAPVPQTPVSLTTMLEMDSVAGQDLHLTDWVAKTKAHVDAALLAFLGARQDKAPFEVPRDLALVPALEIACAASGASSFREVMDYDHLMLSFSKNGQYEAAGTLWMLDPEPARIQMAPAYTSWKAPCGSGHRRLW